jgi:capsular polysaccharide transport system permease protein
MKELYAEKTRDHLPVEHAFDPSVPVDLIVRPLDYNPPSPTSLADQQDWISRAGSIARRNLLAVALLAAPLLASGIYYWLLLSDQYVSETRFVIRSTVTGGVGSLSLMTQTQGLSRAVDEAYLVNEFLTSRDAILLLAREDGLLKALSKPESDIVYGFPTLFSGSTSEALYQHYSQFIDVAYASTTGITTLKVRAFTPHDAQAIATSLLRHAERVVNQLNERAQTDSIQFAVDMAAQAEKRVVSAQMKLAQFRNRTSVIDPDKQSDAILSLVETLSKERSSLETALLETTSSTPNSPRIPALRNRITALGQQILEYNRSLAGGAESMASRKAEYDRLELERELASKSLTAALSTLERARQDVARQQLYLQRVVQPNLPDKSQYPSRLSAMLMIAAMCLAVYWIVKSLADVILAHDA